MFFFPVFIVLVILVMYILAQRGWKDLADKYRYNGTFEGTRIGLIQIGVNSVDYKNAFVLRYNFEGMYFKPSLIFGLFHPPILIPWKEIVDAREKKLLFVTYKELVIGQPFVAVLKLSNTLYRKLESNIPISLPHITNASR